MKRYKIRNFSKYMGVSVDTIKHYQDFNIIKPEINPQNNYRLYNITHGERLIQTQEEIRQLQNSVKNLEYLIQLCDLFNHQVGTYEVCTRPAYYFYRHVFNFDFIEDGNHERLTRELMEKLPNVVKMSIIPYEVMKTRKNQNFYHTIALKEDFSDCIEEKYLHQLEYIPRVPAIRYIYSRNKLSDKCSFIYDIYEELKGKGYDLSTDDIIIENAIDYYVDGVRYFNYLIYFPLSNC